MSIKNRKEFTKEEIENAIQVGVSMGGAANVLSIDWRTFRYNAEKYGLYRPQESQHRKKYEIQDIFDGIYPQYPSHKLKKRLLKEGLKKYECESCGLSKWKEVDIPLELNHKNGNHYDHSYENLELLCPNCHSMTDTYRNKRGKNNGK